MNYALQLPQTVRTIMLDMAYRELKIAIEYDGSYHRFSVEQICNGHRRRRKTVLDKATDVYRQSAK